MLPPKRPRVSSSTGCCDERDGTFVSAAFDLLRPDPAGSIQSPASLGYSPEAAVARRLDNRITAPGPSVDLTGHAGGAAASWAATAKNRRARSPEQLHTAY